MQLYAVSPSPFVRKVLVVAMETRLVSRIEHLSSETTPTVPDMALTCFNPIGKLPTLVTDSGTALYDSRVICEYLDSLQDDVRLFPLDSADRWRVLRCQALADAVLDAAVLIRYETVLRPENKYWPSWVEGQMGKIHRGLDALEAEAENFEDDLDIGIITTACAMGYLDFRFPEEEWRRVRPKLRDWYAKFAGREAMVATEPAKFS